MRVIHSWARTLFRDPLKRGRESSTILLELDQKKSPHPLGYGLSSRLKQCFKG